MEDHKMRKLMLIAATGLFAMSFAATASAECLGHKDRVADTSTESGPVVAGTSASTKIIKSGS
jgi:hypothetical protein